MPLPFPRRSFYLRSLFLVLLPILLCTCGAMPTTEMTMSYPTAPRGEVVDSYHGVQVADPYRWLEELDSPETRRWIEAENRLTEHFLTHLPKREAIRQRLTELWDHERYGVPWKRGGHYFYARNDGLQNQSVIHVQERLDDTPRVLLDPNILSKDGTVALSGSAVSPDGRYFAYALSEAGSDWKQWRVRDITTGRDLPDLLRWVKFSRVSWSADSRGFYYSRYDEPDDEHRLKAVNYNQKLYYHRLGDPQQRDRLIHARPDHKEWSFDAVATEDGRWLVIAIKRGTEQNNLVYYVDLTRKDSRVTPLIDHWQAEFLFLGNSGSRLWFLTDDRAPRYRIVGIDPADPRREQWLEVVPERQDTIESASFINNSFILTYLHDAWHKVVIHPLQGKERTLKLPGIGSVTGFRGEADATETFYGWTSFNTPLQIYRLDLTTGESTLFKAPRVKFEPRDYVTRQIFYQSRDGTRVPMFISHRRDLQPNSRTPTLLYGYGGFNIPLTPWFSVRHLVWMEMGGVLAIPNLRGGGEYGKAWHEAGIKTRKQNVFDDFIAAARWLIANGYASPRQLGINGGSNGGLLVAAVMLQQPDLFGAVVPSVGVLDMLRFNRFTIGWAWESDYGSPDNPEEFKALLAYSPLHNIEKGRAYPPTLITTADHDDRVFPAHSFKFAAALQHAQGGSAPILIRVETRAGHGAGKPTSKRIDEATDILAFLHHFLFTE
jgi:prolyl oligopeptidase